MVKDNLKKFNYDGLESSMHATNQVSMQMAN